MSAPCSQPAGNFAGQLIEKPVSKVSELVMHRSLKHANFIINLAEPARFSDAGHTNPTDSEGKIQHHARTRIQSARRMKTNSDTLVWLKSRRVAVLYGGLSSESAVSRRTGKAVLQAFRALGIKAAGIEADRSLALKLAKQRITYCFIALHGKYGEDGTVQGLCEIMGIPYSGSGVLASALCMNKELAKKIFAQNNIPTLPFIAFNRQTPFTLPRHIKVPCVVKPVDSGSAIGVSIVKKQSSSHQPCACFPSVKQNHSGKICSRPRTHRRSTG